MLLEHRIKQEFAFSSETAMRRTRTRPRNIEICVRSGNTHVGKELDTLSSSLVFVQLCILDYSMEICASVKVVKIGNSILTSLLNDHFYTNSAP